MVSLKKINEKRYAVILIILAAITSYLFVKLRKRFIISDFIIYMIIGTIFGESWQIFISYYDASWPGWWYAPGKVFGYIGKVSYEDIVFYPICGGLFYFIKLSIPKINIKNNFQYNNILLWFLIVFSFICLSVVAIGGKSIFWWFMAPGLAMYFFNRYQTDFINYLITGMFIITMATIWDLFIRDWIYITDGFQHSSLWLSNSWAWIGKSPVEITPWFSIAGWVFIYQLAETIERLRGRQWVK